MPPLRRDTIPLSVSIWGGHWKYKNEGSLIGHTLNVGLQSHGEYTRFNFEGVIFLNENEIGNFSRTRRGEEY